MKLQDKVMLIACGGIGQTLSVRAAERKGRVVMMIYCGCK